MGPLPSESPIAIGILIALAASVAFLAGVLIYIGLSRWFARRRRKQ